MVKCDVAYRYKSYALQSALKSSGGSIISMILRRAFECKLMMIMPMIMWLMSQGTLQNDFMQSYGRCRAMDASFRAAAAISSTPF